VLVAVWIESLLYIVTLDGQFGITISLNMHCCDWLLLCRAFTWYRNISWSFRI